MKLTKNEIKGIAYQLDEVIKHSYVPITYHKTGNTIQIVSQELSALVHKSQRRR